MSATDDERIFPIVDRRTPILERLQGRFSNGEKEGIEDLGKKMGKELAAISQIEDDVVAEETVLALREAMITGVAEELDEDREEMSTEDLEEVLSVIETVEEPEESES